MFKKSYKNASSLQVQSHCAFCQDAESNIAAEEVSLKISKLSSCLQQFVKDFCSAGNISVGKNLVLTIVKCIFAIFLCCGTNFSLQ